MKEREIGLCLPFGQWIDTAYILCAPGVVRFDDCYARARARGRKRSLFSRIYSSATTTTCSYSPPRRLRENRTEYGIRARRWHIARDTHTHSLSSCVCICMRVEVYAGNIHRRTNIARITCARRISPLPPLYSRRRGPLSFVRRRAGSEDP